MIFKRWHTLFISTFIALLAVGGLLYQATASQIEPDPPTTVDTNKMQRVIVHFASPPLPHRAPDVPKLAQRTAVIAQLQQTAVSSQAPLINQLEIWEENGRVSSHRSLWIINAIVVTGTAETIAAIAQRDDVVAVLPDEQHRYFEPTDKFGDMLNNQQLTANNEQLTINSQSPTWGVQRIGAPAVWHGLGIDGDGVTVALMDSGTDWLHPDLLPNYRGNLGGGVVEHAGNWYHTSNPTATEPIDILGHGTHVAGTAVGQNGIGVAPGANWIAVSIADEYGFIYESDVHLGFQWLMAPAGDPALAPDIVNNSWSGSPYAITFLDDVLALQAAAIIPVFAAGNAGPFAETVGSPASYTSTLSIAASDDVDGVAWFSSRGPSPLTAAQNPWIAAPGTATYSSLPNGGYGLNNGTSMATPHVVGTMALLLQANPALTQQEMMDVMAQTAVSISTTHPNADSGWGRLNGYAAVATQVHSGKLTGVVRGDGQPLADVAVVITMTDGVTVTFQTDANGGYHADLRTGLYGVQTAPFGYQTASATNLPVIINQTTTHDFDLIRLPSGTITGVVRDANTNAPLNATVSAENAPIEAVTDANGRFSLTLPAGSYQLIAAADSHRLGRAGVVVAVGETAVSNFTLAPSQSILLVDGGHWYFSSKASYYQESLAALDYNIDTWTIRSPLGAPTLADLAPYDTVIWSNPSDSPGYIGAGTVISDYLGLDKNLLISGQHVGAYDGDSWWLQWWWYALLGADWMGKTAVSSTITGANAFTAITPTVNGAGSANNQTLLDQSRPRTGTLSQPAFLYENGLSAGLQAGHCQPFRIVYTGFGLEGVMADERADIIEHSFAYFDSPRITTGVQWKENDIDDFAIPAAQLSYTFTLRNLSETATDTFDLSIHNATWPTALLTTTLTLGSCEMGQTVITLDVPTDVPPDFVHEMEIIATSRNTPSTTSAVNLRHKIPGHILLVDDDRWYDQQAVYTAMLDEMNLSYDVWDIGGNNGGIKRGSPPLEMLNRYDIVLWYTAYDWFQPITPAENADLTAYLAQGGRLFLTSQDFLYYHEETELARRYFGVMDYSESVEPTLIYGADNGALPLDWPPYQNNGDGVIPANTKPFLFSEKGMGIGTMTTGDGWRTTFLGFPLEKLPTANHAPTMNRIVGWLSDLGDSSFIVDAPTGATGVPRTYTITLRNDPSAPINYVAITNSIPASLTLQIGTITGGAAYNAITRELIWDGNIGSGESHQISYQAIPSAGGMMESVLAVQYDRHELTFAKTAVLSINAPDLSNSMLTAISNSPSPTPTLTYTLRLMNDGQQAAMGTTAVLTFSEPLTMVVGSLTTSLGVTAVFTDHLEWTGDLAANGIATVTLALERGVNLTHWTLPATAVLDDGITAVTVLYNQIEIRPFVQFLPLVHKWQVGK